MICIAETNCVISRCPLFADSFMQRLTGMLTRRFSDSFDGIVFRSCNAIHTFGMKFEIDVIFINTENKVTALYERVKPWKSCCAKCFRATAIELPAGTIAKSGVKCGDLLNLIEI